MAQSFKIETDVVPRDFARHMKVCHAIAQAFEGSLEGYVIEDTGESFSHTFTVEGATQETRITIGLYIAALSFERGMGDGEDVTGRWEGLDDYQEGEIAGLLPGIEELFAQLSEPKH